MKKNIRFAMLLGLCGLFFTACEQEEEQQIISGNCFRVEAPKFVDNEKTYLQYTDDLSRIIYEEGDKVYINGVEFTLSKDGSGTWWANSSQTVTATELYVAYADGAVADWNESAHTYSFNLNSTLNSIDHNKVVLCGTARENGYAITLAPACAILRLNTQGAGTGYSYVKVGFEGGKIPKQGTVTPASHTLSASGSQFLAGVTQGGAGEFLYMTHSNTTAGESDYWYVAIPITGSSVTTTLYLEWNNGTETIQYKTQGEVTLEKGNVYTIGTERVSPFNANACGTYFFYVDESNHRVSFTSGNLQCQKYIDGDFNEQVRWRFAPSQLNSIGTDNGTNIVNEEMWFDLFGYGTSNWSSSGAVAYAPYSTSETNTDYYAGNLAGTNADWGVFNRVSPGIYYGSRLVSFNKLRTLTSAEWAFLINRTGKSGIVCVNGFYYGLMLLPNTGKNGSGAWNNTTDVDLSGLSNTSVTNLTLDQWDALEAIGAIFLPYGGTRIGVGTDYANNTGAYWSATTNTASRGIALMATTSNVSSSNTTKKTGCSVRLVANVGSW